MYPYKHDGESSLPLQTIQKYILEKKREYAFVESGTNLGAGVQRALESKKFKIIYSVELEQDFYDAAKERFKNNKEVHLLKGDANLLLPKLCLKIDEPIFFFSDGHNLTDSSILRDIQCILIRNNPKDILAIDDIRIFMSGDLWAKKVHFQEIVDILVENNYNMYFEDTYNDTQDLLIATKIH